MKKFLSLVALGMAASAAFAEEPVFTYDFVPEVQNIFFQDAWDSEKSDFVNEVRIDVKFNEDVWWVSGFSGQCYLLDKEGNKYDGWYPDFGGLATDYTAMFFGVRGLDKYVDADYTLVIPQGLLGNTDWYGNKTGGKSNPELRYDFNAWKLAGQPREDKTVYDFSPLSSSYSLEEVRINGKRTLELQLSLEFAEPVAINKGIQDKWSVRDAEEQHCQDAILRAFVNEEDPNKVIIGLRGVDLKKSMDYTISIWQGAFGTLEWAAEDYCESHASPELIYVVNPTGSDVESVTVAADSPVFNLQGMRVNASDLKKGIYIRDGKKYVVK